MSYQIAKGLLLYLAILWLVTGCGEDPGSLASQTPRPVKSLVVALQQGQNTIVQTGEIRPRTETSQGFRLDGRIISRTVDVGSLVKAGEVLATLDPRDSENQLRNAEADLNSALSAERLAKLNLTRMEILAPGKAIAQMALDQAKSNWELMVARRQNAQIAVKSARERLGYTRLVASEDGVITSVSANSGQVVNAGQEVVRLASLLERDAVFDVPEQLLSQHVRDPLVSVSLLSDPAIKAVGHIRDISPQADATTRSFRVRVALDQPSEAFVFGSTVQGRVQLPALDYVKLPASALTSFKGNTAVYRIDPATLTLRVVPVHVVRYSADDIYLSAGLNPGDKVVIAGVNKLRPDMKVALYKDQ